MKTFPAINAGFVFIMHTNSEATESLRFSFTQNEPNEQTDQRLSEEVNSYKNLLWCLLLHFYEDFCRLLPVVTENVGTEVILITSWLLKLVCVSILSDKTSEESF